MPSQTTTEWVRPYGTLLLAVALEPKEIGKRIKRAREAKDWTQVELAQKTSNAPSTIQRWEGGKPPPVRELMRLAGILEIPTERLVEDMPSLAIEEEHFVRLEAKLDEVLGLLREVKIERFAEIESGRVPPAAPAQEG